MAGIAKSMDDMKTMLSKTLSMSVEQKDRISKLTVDPADKEAQLVFLTTEHANLSNRLKDTEAELQKSNRKLASLRTPDNSNERKRPAVQSASSSIGSPSPLKRLHFDDSVNSF